MSIPLKPPCATCTPDHVLRFDHNVTGPGDVTRNSDLIRDKPHRASCSLGSIFPLPLPLHQGTVYPARCLHLYLPTRVSNRHHHLYHDQRKIKGSYIEFLKYFRNTPYHQGPAAL